MSSQTSRLPSTCAPCPSRRGKIGRVIGAQHWDTVVIVESLPHVTDRHVDSEQELRSRGAEAANVTRTNYLQRLFEPRAAILRFRDLWWAIVGRPAAQNVANVHFFAAFIPRAPAMIRLRSCPAFPTNGSPCRSSSAPGASPMKQSSGSSGPTPKTVCVRVDASSGQREHWATCSASVFNSTRRDSASLAGTTTTGGGVLVAAGATLATGAGANATCGSG